jgi:hypothetical protein
MEARKGPTLLPGFETREVPWAENSTAVCLLQTKCAQSLGWI